MATTAEVQKDYSIEELQAMLKEKQAKERKEREKKQQQYEQEKDETVTMLLQKAEELERLNSEFKELCHHKMQEQQTLLNEYGKLRSNSKGGFSITHSSGVLRVIRRRDTAPQWDERGDKGIGLVKDFLYDFVKKHHKEIFEILMSYITRNKQGELEYSKVFLLLQHRNKFSDPRWVEGLQLIEESYSVMLRGYNYEFKRKDEHGKWESITVNFTAL